MNRKIKGYLAVSLAGHDCGSVFAVVGEEQKYLLLADGKGRTLECPKKKNRRHIQVVRRLPAGTAQALAEAVTDSDLVHVLRIYRQEQKKEQSERCASMDAAPEDDSPHVPSGQSAKQYSAGEDIDI